MQAEACRRLGLWPLALAIYLDAADLSLALTGTYGPIWTSI